MNDKITPEIIKSFLQKYSDDSRNLSAMKERLSALDELEALRCRAIDIADRLDALEKLTGGERVVFIRPKD